MNLHLSHSERRRVKRFGDAFARKHGYDDAESMAESGMSPEEVIRESIERSPRKLADLFTSADLYGDRRVGELLQSAIEREDLHACDILRDVLKPLIDAEVDARAKAEGVGDYYDVDGVLAA